MSNPYLVMRPELTLYDIPEKALQKLLPYFETVRQASEWNALGFRVSVDETGLPREGKSKMYRFWPVDVRGYPKSDLAPDCLNFVVYGPLFAPNQGACTWKR